MSPAYTGEKRSEAVLMQIAPGVLSVQPGAGFHQLFIDIEAAVMVGVVAPFRFITGAEQGKTTGNILQIEAEILPAGRGFFAE